MKRSVICLVAVLVVALTAPAFAGGKHCTADPEECKAKMQAKMQSKGWLGIQYKTTEEGHWKITEVVSGSPAEAAGFKKGDLVVVYAGAKVGDKESMKKAKHLGPGESASYVVKRDGQKVKLTATLAPVPETVMAKWIDEHMAKYHKDAKVASAKH